MTRWQQNSPISDPAAVGIRLAVEVLDLAAHLTDAEVRLLVIIAEQARESTREWTGASLDLLCDRMDRSPNAVGKILTGLARQGIEVRVSSRDGASPRGAYAGKGRERTFRLPAQWPHRSARSADLSGRIGQPDPLTYAPESADLSTPALSYIDPQYPQRARDPGDPMTTPPLFGAELPHRPTSAEITEAFAKFWMIYPRRVGKKAAAKAFSKAVAEGATLAVLLAGAERYRDAPSRKPEYTAHPTTWLNQGRWDDEPDEPQDAPDIQTQPGWTPY